MDPIIIDGNYLEGGGQIVRTALAISSLTGVPFEATDIRKGRQDPGLKAQHLHCIQALEQLCGARCEGAKLGSTCIKFFPEKFAAKNIEIDVGTAGSVSLLLQSLLLPLMFGNKRCKVSIIGGTAAKWAMPFEYLKNVFLPHVTRFADIEAKMTRRGYFPKGGGKIEISVNPRFHYSDFKSFDDFRQKIREDIKPIIMLEQGNLMKITGISHASASLIEAKVAERQASSAAIILKKRFDCPINIQTEYSDTLCPGSGITIWAGFSRHKDDIDLINPTIIGADALGERGVSSEQVGEAAAKELISEVATKAAVDHHLEDNLIPFMAILGGQIRVSRLTPHTRTNIYTVEKFLGKMFEIDEKERIIRVN